MYYVGGVHTCLYVFMGPRQDIWYPGASLYLICAWNSGPYVCTARVLIHWAISQDHGIVFFYFYW